MRNFEKYEDKLKNIDLTEMVNFFYERIPQKEIPLVTIKDAIDYLYQEYEPFTEDEKVILKNISKDLKWIARDYDGKLCLYEVKPIINSGEYIAPRGKFCYFSVYEHLFKNVTFKDGAICFRGDESEG